MNKVLLDTSFIVSCIRGKIDFMDELESMGFKVFVPEEVFGELENLRANKKTSMKDRDAIDLAFVILKKVDRLKLGTSNVDAGLIEISEKGYYIATLDKEIKGNVKNRIVILSAGKKLRVERD